MLFRSEALIRVSGTLHFPQPECFLQGATSNQPHSFVRPYAGDDDRFFLRVRDFSAAARGDSVALMCWLSGQESRTVPSKSTEVLLDPVPGEEGLFQSKPLALDSRDKARRTQTIPHDVNHLLEACLHAAYPAAKDPIQCKQAWPVFCREPDERREVCVELINVRVAVGGKGVAGGRALREWRKRMIEFLQPLGVLARVQFVEMDPPDTASFWAATLASGRDPSVTAGYALDHEGQSLRVPSPSQIDLLSAAPKSEGTLRIFMLANLYKGLAHGPVNWELFPPYGTFSGDLPALSQQLNNIHLAQMLARNLDPDGVGYLGEPWRKNRLQKLARTRQRALDKARASKSATLASEVFLKTLGESSFSAEKPPRYVVQAINEARDGILPYYKPSSLESLIRVAADKAFVTEPDRVTPDTPLRLLAHWLRGAPIEPGSLCRSDLRASCLHAYREGEP